MQCENEFIDDAQAENEIKGMPDRDLSEFTARTLYYMSKTCKDHGKRIAILEQGNRKSSRINGGISGFLAAFIAVIVDYLVRRGW